MPHTARFRQLVLLIADSPLVSDLGMTKLWKLMFYGVAENPLSL
ncbi:MAG: hypothetical protein OHK0039_01350 [Bacteroidia bacterium]